MDFYDRQWSCLSVWFSLIFFYFKTSVIVTIWNCIFDDPLCLLNINYFLLFGVRYIVNIHPIVSEKKDRSTHPIVLTHYMFSKSGNCHWISTKNKNFLASTVHINRVFATNFSQIVIYLDINQGINFYVDLVSRNDFRFYFFAALSLYQIKTLTG